MSSGRRTWKNNYERAHDDEYNKLLEQMMMPLPKYFISYA